MQNFNSKTEGGEVVRVFSEQVQGKIIVITGPSAGGLGAQTALELAVARPKALILAGRTKSKANPVIEEIRKINPDLKLIFVELDLSKLSSVRNAAQTISLNVETVDILINNAGIMATEPFTKSADGYELQFASNYIGHFLFTNLLMERIFAGGKGARIVNLTSEGHKIGGVNFDDWNFSDGKTYNPWIAYGQSKTANILFTVALAQKLESRGILCFATHPGVVGESKLQTEITEEMFAEGFKIAIERSDEHETLDMEVKTLKSGTSTILVAALSPEVEGSSGSYLKDCNINENARGYAMDRNNSEKLWELSEKLVGQKFSY